MTVFTTNFTGKYPRVCGEEIIRPTLCAWLKEIPPRLRGRDGVEWRLGAGVGNTPASAGKSRLLHRPPNRQGKYPRVCGEEAGTMKRAISTAEIPPRLRGRGAGALLPFLGFGNTPASAGKRMHLVGCALEYWKYPRVCGEEPAKPGRRPQVPEIPPRLRGRG